MLEVMKFSGGIILK